MCPLFKAASILLKKPFINSLRWCGPVISFEHRLCHVPAASVLPFRMQQRCLMQSRRIGLQRSAAPHSAPQQLGPLVPQCSRLAQSTPQQQQATAHSSDGVQLQRRQVVLTGVLMVLSMASPAMAEDGATERQLPKGRCRVHAAPAVSIITAMPASCKLCGG